MSLYDKLQKIPILKELLPDQVRFPGQSMVWFDFGTPDSDTIAREVGDGTTADVLMTPIRWKQKQLREAPVQVLDAAGQPLEGTDLEALLRRPNGAYPWETILDGLSLSLDLDGNGYLLVARNRDGLPVELWYAPHTNIEPRWPSDRSDVWISHYDYHVQGQVQELAPEDVIHVRDGVDLSNLRKGLSPLKGLLREVWTDNEAAAFTAALLRNKGIPGVVISPVDPDVQLDRDEAEAIEATIDTKITRGGRGRTVVMTGRAQVDQVGFSPKELDLSPLRDISEERVTAALGVQAAVVGFGSGLQQTKVGATMDALIRLSWQDGVIPVQKAISGELTRALAQPFNAGAVAFDNTGVEALRENEDTKAARLGRLYRDGVITRAEARSGVGQEVYPGDEVYAVTMTQAFVPQGREVEGLVPTATATATRTTSRTASVTGQAGNGNGAGDQATQRRSSSSPLLVKTREEVVAWYKQHRHSPNEERILEAAPSADPTAETRQAFEAIERARRRGALRFVDPLLELFERLGQETLEATAQVFAELALESSSAGDELEAKQDLGPEDRALAAAIYAAVDTQAAQDALKLVFEEGYLAVAIDVGSGVSNALGVDFELDDAVQQEVMNQGGLRAGLVDLDQQTRDAIFDGLADGRAQGLTADNLARHIADYVEAGPWRDSRTRARVISRTEGANAANVSTLEAARGMPETEHVQVFDNRTGFDDEICQLANGKVVTIDEADAMGLAHPNCTRAFVPVNSLLLEEMGL